ncbi:hypothetical protein BDR26DRAFT_851591 [Obelidium mucronatum]|nr:hypothetical protein BDR26DRAFT_851591 [Obelidium mucronatum]
MPREQEDEQPLDIFSTLPPPPSLPDTPLKTVATLVLMPFFQGMFYGLGEGVARLLVFRWWGIENFTTIPTAGVTASTERKISEANVDRRKNGLFGGWFGGSGTALKVSGVHTVFPRRTQEENESEGDHSMTTTIYANSCKTSFAMDAVVVALESKTGNESREYCLKRV